jgi:hypothetical protein
VSDKYILDGHDAVPCKSLLEWASWFDKADRIVQKTTVGPAEVSTVFLGLDHSFGIGEPLLFETLVFGGPLDQEMDRYSTWEEAEQGHKAMVERARDAEAKQNA